MAIAGLMLVANHMSQAPEAEFMDRRCPQRSVLITGASGGIGAACALRLDGAGFRVFAGVLPGQNIRHLRGEASARLLPVELDITDQASIASAVRIIEGEVGQVGLSGLVNNAGISVEGPLELLPIAHLREQFEVNVLGQIAVTQAFLPLLRKDHGRIVMMGSPIDAVPFPHSGPYAASKSALRTLTGVLRMELDQWGMSVSLVSPGPIATPIWEASRRRFDGMISGLAEESRALYGLTDAADRRGSQKSVQPRLSAAAVAAAVEHALSANRPKARYSVGFAAKLLDYGRVLPLSDELVRWIVRRMTSQRGGHR
jgi:NAD(P)-dependent dehydrogenase (short-subunit alcohol dehydrogenase family)